MNLHMPEKTRFVFEDSKGFIVGLIVYFIFYSKIKNNFTVGPTLTSNTGEIILRKEIVNEIISSNKSDFPMDYDGGLEDCFKISVIVESMLELEARIDRLKEFYPENASSLQKLVSTCSNGKANLIKEIGLPLNEEAVHIIID